jgi:hypothetical protein
MSKNEFFIDVSYGCKSSGEPKKTSDEDLAIINKLSNGPLRKLTADDVLTRAILILGEDKTTKQSIHPENRKIGKRNFTILSDLCKLSAGAPMMIGHNTDDMPWGRIYQASVRKDIPGHEAILEHKFWCMNDQEGQSLINKIDGGILSEGSISYRFRTLCCSVCGSVMGSMLNKRKVEPCNHRIGEVYNGVECCFIPYDIANVMETSIVYRGAYPKTKVISNSDDNDLFKCLNNLGYNPDTSTILPVEIETATETSLETENETDATTLEASTVNPDSNIESPSTDKNLGNENGGEVVSGADGSRNEELVSPNSSSAQGGGSVPTEGVEEASAPVSSSPEAPENLSLSSEIPLQNSENNASIPVENSPETPENTYIPAENVENSSESEIVSSETSENSEELEQNSSLDDSEDETLEENSIEEINDAELCSGCGELYPEHIESCSECGYPIHTVCLAVKLFKPIGPNKPRKSGAVNNEFYDVQGFKKLPSGKYIIEPKYNGIFLEAHRDGDKVNLFTDEGNEVSHKFPSIVSELKKSTLNQFILAGEMTMWRGRKRMSHTDVTGYIHRKDDSDDKEMRYKPFDIVYDGKDLTEESLLTRRSILDKNIKWGQQVHPTMYTLVNHVEGGNKIINAISDRQTREGAMVKSGSYKYTPSGRNDVMKWKRQYQIDVTASARKDKDGGGYVYSCDIGRGKDKQPIGDTFATKIKAEPGETLTVSVDYLLFDEKTGKYSWFAPKVIAGRGKKVPDPLSLAKRIAEIKNSAQMITLTDVIPRLKKAECSKVLYVCGGVVEHGYSTHDLDIITREQLTDEERASVLSVLGESVAQRTELVFDPNGASGPNLPVTCDLAPSKPKWQYANKFVLQEHFWGDKKHYDLRFGAPTTEKMWGWTCFNKPAYKDSDPKVRCVEKEYHDPKWMAIDKKTFKPGEEGNPTKNQTAYMNSIDRGDYEFIKRHTGFLEMMLKGKHLNGRYIWREIPVKEKNADGDETGTKSDKIWILWKPKDQTPSSKVKKLDYRIDKQGVLMIWETEEYED